MNISRLAEAAKELAGQITVVDIVVCMGGVLVLAAWLVKTSFGIRSLVDAPLRRNNMPPYMAVIPLFAWFATAWALINIKEKMLANLPGWQDAIANNLIICIGVIPTMATSVVIVRAYFTRGLKGLGLNSKTIVRDLGTALLNLFAVMPVVLGAIILTTLIGKLIVGPAFEMPQHEELKEIMAYPQWGVRTLIIVTAIVVVPFVEELVFRGMFQTMVRSVIVRPWPAIILTSMVFVIFHENPQHWFALFALSLCLGYAYEKSGSLYRSIFIHSLFNTLSVVAALLQ